MPNRYTYTPEFKTEAVRLYRMSERGYSACSRELGIAIDTLRSWVRQADIDESKAKGLTSEERPSSSPLLQREPHPPRRERDSTQSSAFLRPGDRSAQMRFLLIDEEKSHHLISRLARVLGVSVAGYHAWKRRPPSARSLKDAKLKERLIFHFEASYCTYGAPCILEDLADGGIRASRKRVACLMRENRYRPCRDERDKTRRRKGNAAESDPVADLVYRDFSAGEPNQVWFAGITYVPTWEGWLFLAVVMDACTKRIVGWSMRDDIKSDIVVDALGMGTTMRRLDAGLVHHSDRGAQYRSLAFGKSLRDSGILTSMGETGVPHDNAVTESVMATIKKECVRRHTFKTRDAARFAIFRYIEGFYNPYRRHSSLGNLSPAEFEKRLHERRLQAAAS